ncbi:DoxX family protein [Bizionia myxarmorum]|uniref:DoxX family protein n=1 Tax=Bizionia myxarmorum TaxID=291186 RepID=A0A5D0R5X0_9FLAO|nr:DoxX family protein [Bizionia myxarmorum]TYB76286.1 hypothetical protein ES674_11895 [Bizionia myxarmorum]
MDLLTFLTWFSGLAFIFFGINSFYSKFIVLEFARYGLSKYRKLTGYFQLIGAIGLLLGLYLNPVLLIIASLGLSLLMLAGFAVRIKINDNFIKSFPSLTFAVLNLWIALKAFSIYF